MVAHAFNPSTPEAEAGRWVRGQPDLQSEFQDSQDSQKPCLEKPKKKKKKKKKKKSYAFKVSCLCFSAWVRKQPS